ncbi:SagB family peptide dehydrogenase [Actinophytocola sp.]|uniref:SagB family peptide dehydrogenase n=1 Tax=Actinophytocola sp. TaxID=1872138 RepID=UPI002D7E1BD4|nr:SagB family peptide dehydrogenase [Actinophytocola sp.]HET9141686.1 SagB family peptide dehydrogenase [Actinophytocola sp.]
MASGEGSAARIRLWSLREDVLVEAHADEDRLIVVTRWGETRIDHPGELVRESLRRMSFGPITLRNLLADEPTGPDAPPAQSTEEWAELWRVLDRLSGSVVHSLGLPDGEGPVLSAAPVARHAVFELREVDPTRPARLSRFAAMRTRDGELVLESPLSPFEVVLHRSLASAVAAGLSAPIKVGELALRVGAEEPVVADLVAYLAATGIVQFAEWDPDTRAPRFAEDEDPNLIPWSHHDLLFHARSRMGRHGGPTGAVFPHAGKLPSPPLVKAVPPGPRFPLYRPQTPELVTHDPSLSAVIEGFRLCEDLSDRELSAEQVGELLFRAARIRSVSPASAGAEVTYRISDRPYLSVHGLHELELYVSLHRCAGLSRGIYHYDPQQHALTLINDSATELDDLLDMASVATGTVKRPPVLITLTARVARSAWMYRGIAYSLALTHVGALQQTLCLAATAMGLAACVPAVEPGDVTDKALRLDWPAEIGVGDCIIGYRRMAPHSP